MPIDASMEMCRWERSLGGILLECPPRFEQTWLRNSSALMYERVKVLLTNGEDSDTNSSHPT